VDKQDLYTALSVIWELISESNKYINVIKPWELTKTNATRLNVVLTVLCESIKAIAFGLAPFMPSVARKIFDFINVRGEFFSEMHEDFVDQSFDEPSPLFPKENLISN
jgi:methionyl-tRNA synthetase